MKYGIGYVGSKSIIAEDIIAALPSGKRLIDLFGGGFAISHCAYLSGKWNTVLYNDINPLIVNLIKDALSGKYNYSKFTPEWISRDRFLNEKEQNGYIKYVWSFGNNGNDYIFSKKIENTKKKIFDWVVNKKPIDELPEIYCESNDISTRRKYIKKISEKRSRKSRNV